MNGMTRLLDACYESDIVTGVCDVCDCEGTESRGDEMPSHGINDYGNCNTPYPI